MSLGLVAAATACGAGDRAPAVSPTAQTSTAAAVSVPATSSAPPATSAQRTKNWFDLQVGDCLTEIPAVDLGVVTATVVDCTTPHQAEVFLLAPLAVNTAVADVANSLCGQGFSAYTGRPVADSPFTVSYLIDSNQDRTADNPTPSTAICFLQAAGGGPLTDSARG